MYLEAKTKNFITNTFFVIQLYYICNTNPAAVDGQSIYRAILQLSKRNKFVLIG